MKNSSPIDKKIFQIIRANLRYLVVLAIFLAVIFYPANLLENKAKKAKAGKKSSLVKSGLIKKRDFTGQNAGSTGKDTFVLTEDSPGQIFEQIFASGKSDFYRIVFNTKTVGEATVHLKIRSSFGEEVELANLSLSEQDGISLHEIPFSTQGRFQTVVFEKEIKAGEEEDIKREVQISNFALTRLGIQNKLQLAKLRPTAFSKIKTSEEPAIRYYLDQQYNDSLSEKNKEVIQYFNSGGRYITQLVMKLNKVGSGGIGDYKIKIRSIDETGGDSKTIKTMKFSADDLGLLRQSNGFAVFNFLADLEKDKVYSVEIANGSVVVDSNNYIQLENVLTDSDKASYFKFSYVEFVATDGSGKDILGNSTVEDLGDYLIYSYQNKGVITDLLNVFESEGDIDFDDKALVVYNENKVGNFFTYKVDTKNSFERIALKAELFGGSSEEVFMEFSFDNLNWERIESALGGHEVQKIDYQIGNQSKSNSIVYFRVKCIKEEDDGYFGLNNFSVRAKLLK